MLPVLIILAVVLVIVMCLTLFGAGPSRVVRRRTIVQRRPVTRRVVEEPATRRVVDEPAADQVVEERYVD